jgi:hypothetical protein
MKKTYIILIAVFTLNTAKAQMTNYTTANSGLINNNVNTIAIDAQGNKWFATYGYGVSKFDGINWNTYTFANSGLVSNFIHTIAIDAQGNIWFGTLEGISKFDGTNWTTYTTVGGLYRNNVLSIAFDAQGNKWFATTSGVSKFNDTVWVDYTASTVALPDTAIFVVAIDAQVNKWFGTNYGIAKFDGVNWTTYLNSEKIDAIAIDGQNNIWCGTGGLFGGTYNGVFKFDGTNWTNYNQSNSGLTFNNVTAIAIDSHGNKWFGLSDYTNGGVSMFDETNWTNYNQSNSGLANNTVKSIAIDAQGNKWLGTYGGVSVLSNCGIPPIENICYVEFDSTTSKNSINWTTNLPANVDSINIFNEVSTNVWSLIGSIPSSQNHFIDLNSNPFNQSYSYKITTIDTCGKESDTSAFHTTITLLATYDQGTNTYGFTWSAYQGLTIANYYLYGITAGGTETLIGSVPGNLYFFNYTNPYLGFVKYFVGFNTTACPSKTNHLVKSNYVQAATGIAENAGINNQVSLYPNPVSDNLYIQSALQIKNIEITDITGRMLYTTTFKTIDCSGFAKGVYFVKIVVSDAEPVETEKGVVVKKFVKE